jgi:HTH-type transcriptional regulator / antitoxin HigA
MQATERYLALIRKFPLRPIRSEEENEAALAVIASLGERQREGLLSPEERDNITVLAKLIEEYEGTRYPRAPVTGSAMLSHLIEARGISLARLAADTGIAESTLSGLVGGSRPIGPRQIQVLARYFGADPALLQGE